MKTYHIHINGMVQGVGFRPMVYLLAINFDLKGYVKNGNDGLHVFFNATAEAANAFYEKIMEKAPEKSIITNASIQEVEEIVFSKFEIIVEAKGIGRKEVLVTPDIAPCKSCKQALHDKNDRRYRYPFITCTQCGPRYSIIEDLPYERYTTTMKSFVMCNNCGKEYEQITDRRFFSQTNSCAKCGIEIYLWSNATTLISNNTEQVLSTTNTLLRQGEIIAVKGVGGYLLLCDAANANVIQQLRKRKLRPSKPFALLYPYISLVAAHFKLSTSEAVLLESEAAPIVLLYPRNKIQDHLATNNIAPKLNRLGIMLPSSPLLEPISKDFGKPLIATSANISGSPIIYKDEDALKYLFEITNYIISYNRSIVTPQDDSVIQVTPYTNQEILIRRSRGYAPILLKYNPISTTAAVATGAFTKSSFGLMVNGNVFLSQYLGSTACWEAQQMYQNTLNHCLKLYAVKPSGLIADKHPDYFSHQYANALSKQYGVKVTYVQHHKAHFAAVLAENNLLQFQGPVLGVIWDGSGLGDDGNIWGGEFFKFEHHQMLRYCHFEYFPVIAGENMVMQPRISAFCIASEKAREWALLKKKFTAVEWHNYQSLSKNASVFTSSVGRLFDAVASILQLCDRQTYEGEAALYLEILAASYVSKNGFTMNASYFEPDARSFNIPTSSIIDHIQIDINACKAFDYIAAKFHYSLVKIIEAIAAKMNIGHICFSGGVFQNTLLVDWIRTQLGDQYELYFHQNLSPNDENISFGQLVYFDNNIDRNAAALANEADVKMQEDIVNS